VAIQNAELFEANQSAQQLVLEQARRSARLDWENFLNAIERQEHMAVTYQVPTVQTGVLAEPPTLMAPVQVAGLLVGDVHVEGEPGRVWTAAEADMLNTVAHQAAQQIENLRLLAQAETYQYEAEAAVRRLTREGWENYEDRVPTPGYVYDHNQVLPLPGVMPEAAISLIQPLQVRGETIGEITLGELGSIDTEVTQLVNAISEKLTTHIENVRLFEQTQTALQETRTLYHVSAQLNAAQSLTDVAQAVALAVHPGDVRVRLFTFEVNAHGEPEWAELVADWNFDRTSALALGTRFYLPDFAFTQIWLAHQEIPTFIADINADNRLDPATRAAHQRLGTCSMMVLPLALAGRWIGSVTVIWQNHPVALATADEQFYRLLASQTAVAVNGRLLFAEAQRRATELATVAQVGAAASTLLEAKPLLQAVADLTQTSFGLYHTQVF
jgi:GAF domain-containing protein